MPVTRRATPDDLDLLLVLAREYCEEDRHPFDEDRVRTAFRPLLADDAWGQVWMIGEAEPVGYAVVTWGHSIEGGGKESLLDEIYVRDRRRGIGGRAMSEILEAARAAGARRMFLETESHNVTVRGFYARHGFAVEDSVWMSRDL